MAISIGEDRKLEISYLEPPALLREIGVTAGTVLVRGHWEGAFPNEVLEGEAFVFSADCPPQSFPVRGLVDHAGGLVVLGPSPSSCGGAREWNAASLMRFESVERLEERPRKRKAEPKPESKPKPKPKPKPRAKPRQPPQQPQYQQPFYPWGWR